MKKMKFAILGAVCALAIAGVAVAGANETSGADLAAMYPEHAANAEGGAGIAAIHAVFGCEACHTGDLVAEVEGLGVEGEPALNSSYFMDSETCLSCHGGTWAALAETTAALGEYNPHESIHGTIENCNECHKGHAAQKDVCSECHPNEGQVMKGIL